MNVSDPVISIQTTAPAARPHTAGAHRLGATTERPSFHELDALWEAAQAADNEFSAARHRKASGPDMDRLHEACWAAEDAYEEAFEADFKAA